MKIKTLVFWILWVENSLTLQTVSGQNSDSASAFSFSRHLDDVDLRRQAHGAQVAIFKQARPLLSAEQRTTPHALQAFQALGAADAKPL
ncbi:MAG: hypothetical protein WA183_05040 [Chthoniobacterales bacterium]